MEVQVGKIVAMALFEYKKPQSGILYGLLYSLAIYCVSLIVLGAWIIS